MRSPTRLSPGLIAYAESFRIFGAQLSQEQIAELAALYCSGLIPHAPVYYMTSAQACEVIDGVLPGLPLSMVHRPVGDARPPHDESVPP